MARTERDIYDGPCWYCGAHFGEECRDGSECDPAVHEARHAAEVADLRARLAAAERTVATLAAALRECAEAVGARVAPEASLEFHCRVPAEVRAVVAALRANYSAPLNSSPRCPGCRSRSADPCPGCR